MRDSIIDSFGWNSWGVYKLKTLSLPSKILDSQFELVHPLLDAVKVLLDGLHVVGELLLRLLEEGLVRREVGGQLLLDGLQLGEGLAEVQG